MRLFLILAVLAIAYLPKLMLWELFTARPARLIGPGNALDAYDKLLAALAAIIVSTFVLLWLAARARA